MLPLLRFQEEAGEVGGALHLLKMADGGVGGGRLVFFKAEVRCEQVCRPITLNTPVMGVKGHSEQRCVVQHPEEEEEWGGVWFPRFDRWKRWMDGWWMSG